MKTNAKKTALLLLPIAAIGLFLFLLVSGRLHLILSRTERVSLDLSAPKLIANPRTAAEKTVNGAKMEVLTGVSYDASYVHIPYPKGDVPKEQGACTDVVVRALRNAGYDLQKLIHEDMEQHFAQYPRYQGLTHPDTNIDHRRVPNQMAFLRRHGTALPLETTGEALRSWKPGDIVYWKLDWRRPYGYHLRRDRAAQASACNPQHRRCKAGRLPGSVADSGSFSLPAGS